MTTKHGDWYTRIVLSVTTWLHLDFRSKFCDRVWLANKESVELIHPIVLK